MSGQIPLPMAGTIPRGTVRLQLHHGFTLDDAAAVVPYLASLGVSHLYTSPLLTARPGSLHGYDIVDHNAINPELGGAPALRRLVATLRGHGMGLVVDIVPNHMGVGGADNAWWLDVLEWGRSSPYASYFDIDWAPPDPVLHDRVLAPFLGSPYGECLANGDIRLNLDPATGRLAATYAEHVFPIAPRHYGDVFGELLEAFPLDPARGRSSLRAEAADMQGALARLGANPGGKAAIDAALARFDPLDADGHARLHTLLEHQHYRLAWWRAAADEINWRRFFDVTSLAGIRVELPQVFDATHDLLLRLYAEGLIDGMRIDHVDGLADPRAYCRKLRRRMESAAASRPADVPAGPPYIVVEKILAFGERLTADWQVDGTTGYDFMDQVGALLHDAAGEAPLTALWAELTGQQDGYEAEERRARRLVLRDLLSSELNGTAAALHRFARRNLATRDYTLTAIRRVLTEILVHFPVYRLYAGLVGRPPSDDQVLARAAAGARRTLPAADGRLLDLINLWLGGEAPRALPPGPQRRDQLRGIVRFEQLSSPVAAKSVEDTAFYRYGRLLSRNEVGANPGQFARSPAAFHAVCADRARRYPHAMLATATHDHKRGEDVRARLAVLSEIPEEWGLMLRRWTRLNAPLRRDVGGSPAPDPAEEVMLYQMLVGAWPIGLRGDDAEGVRGLVERLVRWQEKALREAKRHTAWVAPNEAYETACREFVFAVVEPGRASQLAIEIAQFVDQRLAAPGAINGLTQTLLRMTTPGLPDLYQGTELWDLSLVDPDNRRPVDFAQRQAMLAALPPPPMSAELAHWKSGAMKQALIARTLAQRARRPELFAEGHYHPLRAEGHAADHVLAFARQHGEDAALVVTTLHPTALLQDSTVPLVPPGRWQGTRIVLPRSWAGRALLDVVSGTRVRATGTIPVATLFAGFPVALLMLD